MSWGKGEDGGERKKIQSMNKYLTIINVIIHINTHRYKTPSVQVKNEEKSLILNEAIVLSKVSSVQKNTHPGWRVSYGPHTLLRTGGITFSYV